MRETKPHVVMTGGSQGIGRAVAADLQSDYTVTSVSRRIPDNSAPGITYVSGDLSDGSAGKALQDSLADQGAAGIYGIVHAAGAGLFGTPFLDQDPADWERTIHLNLNGTLTLIQQMAPMVQEGGRIVLYSSGTVFKMPPNAAVYAATKAAVIGFAGTLAAELGERSITVNVIAPGLVITELSTDLAAFEEKNIATRAIKRKATLDDFTGPTRFFLSEGARFVTGQTMVVDGGSIRR